MSPRGGTIEYLPVSDYAAAKGLGTLTGRYDE